MVDLTTVDGVVVLRVRWMLGGGLGVLEMLVRSGNVAIRVGPMTPGGMTLPPGSPGVGSNETQPSG